MIIIRPVETADLDELMALNTLTYLGLTSFPKDRSLIEKKIDLSVNSFQKKVLSPRNELYLFVLEDISNKKLVGISAMFATTGGEEPLYFYKRETITVSSPFPKVISSIPILIPVSYEKGPSELCSLFLHPRMRQHGLGKLLSWSRFLFIANFPDRFTNSLYAEMRGVIENESSPFWEGIGRHFFDMSFKEAIDLLKYGRRFIAQFLPKYPIYVSLLPQEVQAVIGESHPLTKAATTMLINQGFKITPDIDIFDGGPKLKANRHEIHAIKESVVYTVAAIKEMTAEPTYILANCRLDYRACLGACEMAEERLCISPECAEALQVQVNDSIRIYFIH